MTIFKHKPSECVIFQESGMFCEDCTTKWYECAYCEAGYEDQKCTCKLEENDGISKNRESL